MKLDILEINTFMEGTFTGECDGITYTCRVLNKKLWDKLYSYLTKPIEVTVLEQEGNNLLVAL